MENKKVEKVAAGSTITWPDMAPDNNLGVNAMNPTVSPGFKQQTNVPDLGAPDEQIKKSSEY